MVSVSVEWISWIEREAWIWRRKQVFSTPSPCKCSVELTLVLGDLNTTVELLVRLLLLPTPTLISQVLSSIRSSEASSISWKKYCQYTVLSNIGDLSRTLQWNWKKLSQGQDKALQVVTVYYVQNEKLSIACLKLYKFIK